ncbi:MAG: chemotaxis protein CheW [Verrucomicrobia bacterium]|nr:chemotaxis protein CheW [Verrucomicrobiota bacterium]
MENKPDHRPPAPSAVADCWDQIGVLGGDRSCPELERFGHCRNCPTYTAAGTKLLDRPLPAGYREEWTRRFAEAKADAAAGKESVLIFRVGHDWLALPTPVFQEVAERRPIHSLPHQRNAAVLGLANVRGELLVCVSLARLLGLPVAEKTEGRPACARLLVAGWHGQRTAFPVDEISGITRFQPPEIRPLPARGVRPGAALMRGVLAAADRPAGVLDAEMFFSLVNGCFV